MIASPHRRYNPLLDEWVLCSPHRLERPWQGQVEDEADPHLLTYDPTCYLCPGNVRANGARNPAYTVTFAFDNDYPALLPDTTALEASDPMLRAEAASGACRVICFSPRHDVAMADLSRDEIGYVVDAWAAEADELGKRGSIQWVQIFENKGAIMGCSNPHPHCQVWATDYIPEIPARKLAMQRAYFQSRGTDLLGDYLERERRDRERIVCANEHWTALVPFWAVWPFETMIIPSRRVADLASLISDERDALSDVLKRINARYDSLFHTSFPYSMGWHGQPTDGAPHPYARLHATYFPPLLRSAAIRKFLVGFELTAEAQRDLTPEAAADQLRQMPETRTGDTPR